MRNNLFLLFLFFISCQSQQEIRDQPFFQDTTIAIPLGTDGLPADKYRLLDALSTAVLQSMRDSNYTLLSTFFHPDGIRISPYGFIDTSTIKYFTTESFTDSLHSKVSLFWGYQAGSGDSIKLNIVDYFKKFVYDRDFIIAPQTSVNRFLGFGNNINNLNKIFDDVDFTEHYFPGTDRKYKGLDWRSLRLIFKLYRGKYFLTGIVHAQWVP